MLLSMFISLLLARKFKGKVFVLLITAVLILISVSSAGFPSIKDLEAEPNEGYWQVNLFAIPLSFPFHAHFSEVNGGFIMPPPLPHFIRPPYYDVKLYSFGFEIGANYFIPLTTNYVVFLTSFFLLVNLVGAIFGYWISKTTFMNRYFARRKPETETTSNELEK